MPASLRRELEKEAEALIDAHSSSNRERLRNDPRFSAWTGTHLGHRGDKYFDRVLAAVKKKRERQSQRRRRARAEAEGQTHRATQPAGWPHTARDLGDAGAVSFTELMADLCEQRDTLKAEAAALLDDGEVLELERYERLAAGIRAVGKAMLDLSKQYQSTLKDAEVRAAIFERIGREFVDEPERGHQLTRDLNRIIHGTTGLTGT